MEEEIVTASSSITVHGIGCRDLHTGTEPLRYKSCASPPVGIISVAADSWPLPSFRTPKHLQAPSSTASSGVKCIPEKPIKSLDGGGLSGNIYFWEVKPISGTVTGVAYNTNGNILLAQQGLAAAAEMAEEKLMLEIDQLNAIKRKLLRWKKVCYSLHESYVDEIFDGDDVGNANQILT